MKSIRFQRVLHVLTFGRFGITRERAAQLRLQERIQHGSAIAKAAGISAAIELEPGRPPTPESTATYFVVDHREAERQGMEDDVLERRRLDEFGFTPAAIGPEYGRQLVAMTCDEIERLLAKGGKHAVVVAVRNRADKVTTAGG